MSDNQSHQQQSWQYQDGNNRVSMSYQSSSYSSQGRTPFSSFSTPLPPAMPTVQAPSIHGLHQQMHAAAMQHHQSAMQHFSSIHQSMQANMLGVSTVQMAQPQLQLSSPQLQLPAPAQPRLIEAVTRFDSSSDESSDEDDTSALQQHQNLLSERQPTSQQQSAAQQQAMERYAADKQELEAHRRAMEQRYNADRQSIQRQGAKMEHRLAKLEAKETKNRAEQEAKDAELRQLREENSRLAQQRYHDAEKHRNEMAELARMQANKSQAAGPVFDTSALEKVIREVQAQQLSKGDIETVIQERVASQLQGLAKKKDIEAAGTQVQSALNMMPSGASLRQIQQAVNQELGKAVTSLSSKMSKQRAIEPAMAAPTATIAPTTSRYDNASILSGSSSRGLPPTMQKPTSTVPSQGSSMPAPPMLQQKQSAVVVPSVLSKAKKDKSKSATSARAPPNTLALTVRTQAKSIAPSDDFPDTSSKISSWRRSRPSKHELNSLPRVEEAPLLADSESRVSKSSKSTTAAMPLVKAGGVNALIYGSGSDQALPADLPDTASKISSWGRSKAKKSSKHAMPIIEEADTMIYSPPKHTTKAVPAIEQRPMAGTLVKSKKAVLMVEDFPPGVLAKQSKDITTKSANSAPTNAAFVKNYPGAGTGTAPLVAVMNMPRMGIGMLSMPQEFSLPADFPDTASQISSWERGRPTQGLIGVATLPTVQGGPGGQQLVRGDKKKSSKK